MAGSGDPFDFTFLFIQAERDNSRVVVISPGGVTLLDQVVNQGENVMVSGIEAGTVVEATDGGTGDPRDIQAGLLTSRGGTWDARFFTLRPDSHLGNDYVLPAPSMQFPIGEYGGRGADTSVYVHAFQDNTEVNIETASGSQAVILDEGEVFRFAMPRLPRDQSTGPYGARVYTSDAAHRIRVLAAGDDNVTTVDTDADDLDWGYEALDVGLLSNEYHLPFAPANPLHISPVGDDTTVLIDFNHDGVADHSVTLDRLETAMVFPPPFIETLTGARVFSNKDFAVVWGQDNSENTPGERQVNLGEEADPPALDLGYTVLPPVFVEGLLNLTQTALPAALPGEGGISTFAVVVAAAETPVHNIDLIGNLPTGWEYVPDSTSVSRSDTGLEAYG
ncbi:MAG: hypothetical protein GWO24_34870, partial [Akkermansiaceae bacterium]|nr:hypothetical protein [Akkermansiaceae bacterium]